MARLRPLVRRHISLAALSSLGKAGQLDASSGDMHIVTNACAILSADVGDCRPSFGDD
jgi:hypothetical protein